MIENNLSVLIVFVSGILAFFSPCILPLIPSYISLVTGVSLYDLKEDDTVAIGRVLVPITLFCLGFTISFVALGTSVSMLGQFLLNYQKYIELAGGVMLVTFAAHMLGLIKIKFLYYSKNISISHKVGGTFMPLLIGIIFALGWTPCVGPILSSVLVLASASSTVWQGVFLLSVFSLGLTIPFIVIGVFINKLLTVMPKFNKYVRYVEIGSGSLVGAIGIWFLYRGFF